jgi:hypothetical protein
MQETQPKQKKYQPLVRPRQRKLAKALVENAILDNPKTLGEVVESAGYPATAGLHPKKIIMQKGTQEALREMGLKDALIKQGIDPHKIARKIDVLLEALDKEGNPDYTAIDKGLKHATGIYGVTEEPKETGSTYNFFFNPEIQEKIKVYEAQIKEVLSNVQPPKTNQETLEFK